MSDMPTMSATVMREVAAILGRALQPSERVRVRAKVASGMMNPYDVIAACGLRSEEPAR
jgi:hypothetical protein